MLSAVIGTMILSAKTENTHDLKAGLLGLCTEPRRLTFLIEHTGPKMGHRM